MIVLKPEFGEKLAELAAAYDGFVPTGLIGDLTGYAAFDGEKCVGYLLFRISAAPDVTRLSFAAEEIGDGLLKAAAEFSARIDAGRLTCSDLRDTKVLAGVGMTEESGKDARWGMNPAEVKHNCRNCPFR